MKTLRDIVSVVLALSLSACGVVTNANPFDGPVADADVLFTVEVDNMTGGPVTFYIEGSPVGTIDAADDCLVVSRLEAPAAWSGRLEAVVMSNDRIWTSYFSPGTGTGWWMELGWSPHTRHLDSITLQRAARCDL